MNDHQRKFWNCHNTKVCNTSIPFVKLKVERIVTSKWFKMTVT